MKRIIFLTIIFLTFCVTGVLADSELATFQNHCWTCSYISIEITGNNYSKSINLGGMGSFTTVNIPAGNYNLYAICESGASKGFEWNYQIQIEFINLFDFYCPPPTTTTIYYTTTVPTPAPPCTAEKIYGEDSDEVELLRYFRDNVLNQTPEGRELIRLFYLWSPAIVKAMEEDEGFKEEMKEMIDRVLSLIKEEVK